MHLTTDIQDLVLIGGGHSHLAVIKSLGMTPIPGLRVTVISRDIHTPYSGMMPALIAGHYHFDQAHIDLRPLCQQAGIRLFHSSVTELDLDQQLIHCDNRPPVRFDWLSINVGSRPNLDAISGASETGIAVKPIDHFLDAIEQLGEQLLSSSGPHSIAIVGGGAASVEVSLALQYKLQQLPAAHSNRLRFELISATEQLLPAYTQRVRRYFARLLKARNIHLTSGSPVSSAQGKQLTLSNGKTVDADTIIWALSAASPQWPSAAGLDCDEQGFIKVNHFLQSSSHPQVFAAGDIAHFSARPLAKSGVYAVRAGQVLAKNLRHLITGKPLTPFKPQQQFLSLLMTGDKYAVAARGKFSFKGRWVWQWKNRIDSAFIEQFKPSTAMTTAPDHLPAAAPMRCGGCGAKVGNRILQRVMSGLNSHNRDDIIIGLNAPDDAAAITPPPGKTLLQTVDYFRAFIDDPYLLGRIASNHCLSDIYAMGGKPHSALAIVTLPHASEKLLEDNLRQLMQGAVESLNKQHTSLIGGHTSEGAELSFGLSVNGFIAEDKIISKAKAVDGHCLILSKALGTGTILAANMHNMALGRWVDSAIEQMLVDNSKAAELLYQHGASACTDITGFGLLGHLLELLGASQLGAQLHLNAIPLLPGALQCLEQGQLSTLHPSNAFNRKALLNAQRFKHHPCFNILFDPQTAGGLLATIPTEQAGNCLRALKAHGLADAEIIGSVDGNIIAGTVLLH